MTFILALLLAIPRPDCPPVTTVDVARALAMEQVLQTMRFDARDGDESFLQLRRDRMPGRFTAGFDPGRLDDARERLEAQGAKVLSADRAAGFLVCEMPDAVGMALAAGSAPAGTRWFEPDARMHASFEPNDPLYATMQWDKWVMYADQAWDAQRGNTSIAVAVCDNGVEYTHPDLVARFTPGEYGRDFVRSDDDPRPDDITINEAFHGTHVSGICAATADNGIGVAGIAQVRLMACRVLNDSGSGLMSDLAYGIRWAVDHGARVVSMSLGSDDYSTPVAEAAQYAAARNVLLVAAAGNQGAGQAQYPARLAEVVCVGALDQSGNLAEYSNYGSHQDVVAPGSSIHSTWVGGTYGDASGTSMATPEVSGVAALVLSADPSISATRCRAILGASAIDMGESGQDLQYGYGLVNAYRAVSLAGLLARQSAPPVRATGVGYIADGSWAVPAWAQSVEVFDASGRGRPVTSRNLELRPGMWFVRLGAPGRSEFVRLSCLR